MKRVLSACFALSLVGLLAGCGGPSVVSTPDGKTTVSDGEGNTVTSDVSGKETVIEGTDSTGAKTTVKTGSAVDLTPFGLEVYPGAEFQDNLSASGSTTADGGTEMVSAVMTTADSHDKVIAFYKGKMKKVEMESKAGDAALLIGTSSNDSRVNVNLTTEGGKTQITLIATRKP